MKSSSSFCLWTWIPSSPFAIKPMCISHSSFSVFVSMLVFFFCYQSVTLWAIKDRRNAIMRTFMLHFPLQIHLVFESYQCDTWRANSVFVTDALIPWDGKTQYFHLFPFQGTLKYLFFFFSPLIDKQCCFLARISCDVC